MIKVFFCLYCILPNLFMELMIVLFRFKRSGRAQEEMGSKESWQRIRQRKELCSEGIDGFN